MLIHAIWVFEECKAVLADVEGFQILKLAGKWWEVPCSHFVFMAELDIVDGFDLGSLLVFFDLPLVHAFILVILE